MRMKLVLISCFAIFHLTFAENECHINVKKGMHPVSPPLVINRSNPSQHMHPTADRPEDLTFQHGKKFLVICPGLPNENRNNITEAGSVMAGNRPIESFSATVECIKNKHFLIDGKKISFAEISCDEMPDGSNLAILRRADRKCDNGKRYKIGYDLDKFGFLEVIHICHDSVKTRTLWAHAIMQPYNVSVIDQANQDNTRFSYGGSDRHFQTGSLYEGMTMHGSNSPYNKNHAHKVFEQLLGKDVSDYYLSTNKSDGKYLTKGHLIANVDMMFQREQRSTYFFGNAVPMWQKINAHPGNWHLIEKLVRSQANNLKRSLNVYAGGLRTLQINGKLIYLYKGKKIPVPKVLFKCMLDHQKEQGLCFLVANNPYIKGDRVEDYVLCHRSDACERFSDSFEKVKVGFTYCCSLNNFYRAALEELGDELESFRYYSEMRLH